MTINTNRIKAFAKKVGADVVGVANIERFKDAPPDKNPLSLLPEARSVVVIGRRVLRGLHRPIEEGTGWHAYNMFGYGGLSVRYVNKTVYELACYIEDLGYQAVPHSAHTIWNIRARAKKAGYARPEVCVTLIYAAYAAGLGEVGWSKVFLNPEYGPMLRFGLVITDAPFKPDPLFEGKLCDRCKQCVKNCPAGAIHPDKEVRVKIGEGEVIHNDLHIEKCLWYHWGLSSKVSPFLPDGIGGEYPEGMTMDEICAVREEIVKKVPMYARLKADTRTQAICGSKGCGLACVRHLEKLGKISKVMKNNTEGPFPRATVTYKKVFLQEEPIPKGFIEECQKEGLGKLSKHCEGVG